MKAAELCTADLGRRSSLGQLVGVVHTDQRIRVTVNAGRGLKRVDLDPRADLLFATRRFRVGRANVGALRWNDLTTRSGQLFYLDGVTLDDGVEPILLEVEHRLGFNNCPHTIVSLRHRGHPHARLPVAATATWTTL